MTYVLLLEGGLRVVRLRCGVSGQVGCQFFLVGFGHAGRIEAIASCTINAIICAGVDGFLCGVYCVVFTRSTVLVHVRQCRGVVDLGPYLISDDFCADWVSLITVNILLDFFAGLGLVVSRCRLVFKTKVYVSLRGNCVANDVCVTFLYGFFGDVGFNLQCNVCHLVSGAICAKTAQRAGELGSYRRDEVGY